MDLSKIKARLESLTNTASKSKLMWKPDPKKTNIIRIVPYKKDPENPFIELYFHYNVNKKTYLSPISFGRPDPFVEFAETLKKKGDKENWKLGKQFEPKMRTHVPILVRGQESEGVRYWGFGKQVYENILSIISDEDYGDITDPTNGRDITVKYTEAVGQEFAKTDIIVKPNKTPMTADKSVLELIKNQPDILEVFSEPSYEELTEALKKMLDPEVDESEDHSPEDVDGLTDAETSSGDEEKPQPKAASPKMDDLEKQFEDLFK